MVSRHRERIVGGPDHYVFRFRGRQKLSGESDRLGRTLVPVHGSARLRSKVETPLVLITKGSLDHSKQFESYASGNQS